MACNCQTKCNCYVSGANGNVVTGTGEAADPFVVTAPNEELFAASNVDGTIDITPGGVAGHSPVIDLVIDPASTAPVSKSPLGLKIDCCGVAGTGFTVVTLTSPGGIVGDTDLIVLADSASGLVTVSLPATHTAGRIIKVKDIGLNASVNNITINSADADLIDTVLTATIFDDGDSLEFASDGTDWWIT